MRICAVALVVLGIAACAGDDDSTTPDQATADEPTASIGVDDAARDDSGSDSRSGAIVEAQPAGQALVAVEGQEYTMQEPGALDCTISDEAITFSFRIGDNEITLGAGANRYDEGWVGNISLRVANPIEEAGPINYFPDLAAHGDLLTIDGNSASYSGPMQKQPPNDGSNPPPVEVGAGIISVTCP